MRKSEIDRIDLFKAQELTNRIFPQPKVLDIGDSHIFKALISGYIFEAYVIFDLIDSGDLGFIIPEVIFQIKDNSENCIYQEKVEYSKPKKLFAIKQMQKNISRAGLVSKKTEETFKKELL